ncbi:MAG: hypothetical protein GY679_01410 [Mycoplasma sp.]|nr:hypothetical protein [Mycoplasma sp.]
MKMRTYAIGTFLTKNVELRDVEESDVILNVRGFGKYTNVYIQDKYDSINRDIGKIAYFKLEEVVRKAYRKDYDNECFTLARREVLEREWKLGENCKIKEDREGLINVQYDTIDMPGKIVTRKKTLEINVIKSKAPKFDVSNAVFQLGHIESIGRNDIFNLRGESLFNYRGEELIESKSGIVIRII